MKGVLIILLLLAASVHAETTLVDSSNGEEITNALITVTSGTTVTDYLIRPGQRLELPTFTDDALLEIRQNLSPQITHAGLIAANSTPKTLIVYPAGLLRLTVKDAKDNFVAHASVTITCARTQQTGETDRTGTLRTVLPAEDCVIAVAAHDTTGTNRIAVKQGTNDITLVLDSRLVDVRTVNYLPWLLILTLVVIGFVIYKTREKEAGQGIKQHLTAKEQMIVDALVARGGSASLAELRSSVRIPRTSLLRTIDGLEHRSVLIKKSDNSKVIITLLK